MSQPEISILIPVYNVEKYLRECLDHALGQTLQNIEVVCVNDCSTDGSLAILQEYAKKDSRLKIIDLPENKGLYNARKVGVQVANSQYSLFCDSDDYLAFDACQMLQSINSNAKYDAIMFSGMAFGGSVKENDAYTNLAKCITLSADKSGVDYFLECTKNERNYVWGWLFKTDTLRYAYNLLPEACITYLEDAFILPFILAKCQSVAPLQLTLYYYRRGGHGVTSALTYASILARVNSYLLIEKIHNDILYKNPNLFPVDAEEEFLKYHQDMIHFAIMHFIFSVGLSNAEAAKILKLYFQNTETRIATKYLILQRNKMNYCKYLKVIEQSGIITNNNFCPQKIKTIAISYERFTIGGVERYMLHVINLFIQMGMKVVLLTTERDPEHDLALPAGAIHYELGRDVMMRIDRLSEIIEKEKIDLYYEQGFSAMPDLIVCKLRYNLPVIAHWHIAFSCYMRKGSDFSWSFCLQHRFYDLTLCLSDIAAIFFRSNGVKAKYLMNIQGFTADSVPSHPGDRPLKTILWLARLDAGVKQPRAAVQIMQEVLKTIPDAKLLIVGGPTPWNPDEPELLADMIRDNGLENNITLCGEQLDVESYYRQADVFLMTSSIEGLGNTIYEASAHGLPVVMYDLPYLAYHSYPENGIVSVPMNDKNAAAEAICRILQNEDEHRELSARSRKMAEAISAIDFEQEWREIFAALERGGEEFLYIGKEHQEALRAMMETLREHTLQGVNIKLKNLNNEIARVKKNLNDEITRLKKKQGSWLFRKLRGGVKCLKDNGFHYTAKQFLKKVKGKLSRRKKAI